MLTTSIYNPENWADLWQAARQNCTTNRRRIRSEQEMVDHWNQRAKWFAQRTGGQQGQKRWQAVREMLEREGALASDFKVLDIGAGPGSFSIPLAKEVQHVTALEPAVEMVKILQDRAETEQLNNISVITRTWQEIDVEQDGLAKQFDLVFASMTPGVNDYETLQKMMAASKKFCYLSAFSGRWWWGHAYRRLWRQIFNEDMGDISPSDIFYPLSILYAMGYRPSLQFTQGERVQEQTVKEAVENLTRFFWGYTEITPTVEQIIADYVEQKAQNGVIRDETRFCHGMLVWRVDQSVQ